MNKKVVEEPITAELESTSEVIIASKKPAMNHLIQGSGLSSAKRKRQAEEELPISDDEFESTFQVRHSAATRRERRRSSSPPAEISAESIKANAEFKLNGGVVEEAKDDGLYHGKAGLAHKLPKAFGPIKGGPGNVRTITIVDYQPDVCKDYKGSS